jgi:hypothetical protein
VGPVHGRDRQALVQASSVCKGHGVEQNPSGEEFGDREETLTIEEMYLQVLEPESMAGIW